MIKDNRVYGPQYQSGRPRILSYGNDDHVLYLWVEMPDGSRYTDTFVLPKATPMPDEYRLTNCWTVGRRAYAYAHLRHVSLRLSREDKDYYAAFDIDDINKFQEFMDPLFRLLSPSE